ncbi:MAG: hypothetical protein M1276_07165 [Deltaproteobacteria bacterium]|nr:hypothetical protein [Deltaproteobacteria bacterium]
MENSEKLGIIDNNDRLFKATGNGFQNINKISVEGAEKEKDRGYAAIGTFIAFVTIGLISLLLDFATKQGLFGLFAFICGFLSIPVSAIIAGTTNWNKNWNESEWKKAWGDDIESESGKYYDGEDDPITGTDYAGSDGNIYD